MILDPQIRILSGPSAARVVPVDESGVRLSDEFIVRLHDGRAVAYMGTGQGQEPRCLLDHNYPIRTGECDFRFEHFEFDPARVTHMFPEITPCNPMTTPNDDVQNYFVGLIRKGIARRLRVAIILNSRGPGLLGYGTYYPELFLVQSEIIDKTQEGFLPGICDQTGRVFCAKLSQDNRCLGVLYVRAVDGGSFSRQERIDITRIAGYLSIFLAPFEPRSGVDDIEPAADAMELRRRNVIYLMADRIPGAEKLALILAEGNRTADSVNFIRRQYPVELEPDRGIVWAAFTSEGGLARNKDGTICSIAINDLARFGRVPESRLGVLYIESSIVNTRDPEVVARLREVAAFASTYLPNYSTDAQDARPPKKSGLAVISGPDKGKVISLNDGPIDFGPGGPDDPEPIYRVERTDQGTVLRGLPEAIEQRPKNVLALILERIPATTNAALILAEGKRQRNKVDFCAYLRPPNFSIADPDAVFGCFFGKEGVVTSHNGAICAVAIKDRKRIGKGPKSRLGILYIQSANDAATDPDQLTKLKEIAEFASKYLSIPTPEELLKGSTARKL